jgi:hypothetical protein
MSARSGGTFAAATGLTPGAAELNDGAGARTRAVDEPVAVAVDGRGERDK